MLNTILILLSVIYISYVLLSKKEISDKGTDWLTLAHYISAITIIVTWALEANNIYFRGYWSTKIIYWLFFFSGVILYAFGKRQNQTKNDRRYLGLIFFSPFLLILLILLNPYMGIPMIGAISNHAIGKKSDIYYSDSKYRIQRTKDPSTSLFIKKSLYEIREPLRIGREGSLDSTSVIESKDSLNIQFYFKNSNKYNNPYPYEIKIRIYDE